MKYTVIANVEGDPILPYVEAENLQEAIIKAIESSLTEDSRHLARQWYEKGNALNDTCILAVFEGHIPILEGDVKAFID